MDDMRIRPLVTHNLLKVYQQGGAGGVKETGFGDLLKQTIDKVDEKQKSANVMVERAISGTEQDLHRVMIAQEEASITFELLMEVRNKLMNAYQQIMQMQI